MKITEIAFSCYPVTDMARAREFYEDVLGLFHSHFFLKQIVKYGKQLNAPPDQMPSGWAAVLYLFNLR